MSEFANREILLITRADDAGSGKSADLAIAETIDEGIVKNVSLMAVGPSIAHAADLLADKRDVCFGLHVTLNAEWDRVRWGPLSPRDKVPTLVESSGYFTKSPAVFLERPPRVEEILREMQTQLDRLRGLGFAIGYADTHMAFEWAFPQIAEPFDRWCEREGILSYRHLGMELPKVGGAGRGEVSAEAEDPVARVIAQLARAAEAGAEPSADSGPFLLVGHPGYDDAEMRNLGSEDYPGANVAADRVRERLMFMDPAVLEACRRYGFRPIRYDEARRDND